MNDHFVPEGIRWWGSFWLTITSDPFLIHFLHRWWAWVAFVALLVMVRTLMRMNAPGLAIVIIAIVLAQIMLGIATVLSMVSLPIAALHQLVGSLLFAFAVAGAHRIGRVKG
jgi:cytochrome c oxidase assembly protein subunit 15